MKKLQKQKKTVKTKENDETSQIEDSITNEQSTGNSKNFATKDPTFKFGHHTLKSPNSSNVITTNKGNISVTRPCRRKVAHKLSVVF